MTTGLNLELLGKALAIRLEWKLKGYLPPVKIANGVKYTIEPKLLKAA